MADAAAPTVALAAQDTDAGAMERLFLLEAPSPSYIGKYDPARNLEAMRLMRQTIENRLKSPSEYGARGAKTATDIVELGNQFAGFGRYPVLSGAMRRNLDDILAIANSPRHPQQTQFVQFVRDAIAAATEPVQPVRAAYANVTAWRTKGSSAPGPRFRKLETVSGNDFYSTDPVPPLGHIHVHHRMPRGH